MRLLQVIPITNMVRSILRATRGFSLGRTGSPSGKRYGMRYVLENRALSRPKKMSRNLSLAGILCRITCLALLSATAQAATEVRVIGQRVNLRAKPDLQSEVSGQVNRGDRLTVKSMSGEWVEIVPPDSVKFWVHKDFIVENHVVPPRLNVRAGPGVNYSVVAVLPRDTPVKPLSSFGDWISIEAAEDASLWVSRELVEVIRVEPPRPPPAPPEPPTPQPVVETLPRPLPPTPSPPPAPAAKAPEDLNLIPLEGQGAHVERTGTLRLAGFVLGRPSRFRLTRTQGHTYETLCYVRGNDNQLQSLVGRPVTIKGHEYWVQGVRHPILVPQQIMLLPDSE
jgi:SH3-like domain-containing protein